ncbi:hypothetical protein N7493_004871 [Penicillium malachiteum]|uniref:Lipocalin-like domain-containing protein n=1 Tax=Penicillium malachiteum TaxID=1324776 RepID=A0AAD6HMF9_9EURO|nr:hypothetical protein N7493_004871 [Penicillium malachiteum]
MQAITLSGEKTLEILRNRLLDAVKKEAAALIAENFGSAEDIDRNFKSLFLADLGPNEIADPDPIGGCNDDSSTFYVISHSPRCVNQKRSVELAKLIHDNLVGVWKMLEWGMLDTANRNHKIHPWGPTLEGQMMFSPNGYVNGLLLVPGQAEFGGDEPWTAGASELAESARKCCSYSGKFFIEMTTIGPSVVYDLDLCNYPVFREQKFRVFVDFFSKDDQQYLIATLTSSDSASQKQEVFRKM